MKKLILILLLFQSVVYGQVIKYPGYTAYYNAKTLIPDSVIWTITAAHLTGVKIPRKNQFHPEKRFQNLKRDYANSGYDQGHNSPYDDNYWSTDAEYQCFSYCNMFPQRHILNAQTWEHLEDYSRKLALKYGSCKVKSFWGGIDKTIGPDKVTVPLYCYKTIYYADSVKTYRFPNCDTVIRQPFQYYLVK